MNILSTLQPLAVRFAGLALIGSLGICAANAQLLLNSGFESGLSGWTVINAAGSNVNGNWYSQTGTTSPVIGLTVAAPVEGSFAAMADQSGAGSHVLYQNFVVPVAVSAADLTFSYTIRNTASAFVTGSNLSFTGGTNQQARVDIITTAADAFSVASGDVLLNIFQTKPGDPLNSGVYNLLSTDLTALFQAHAGETLRLRFAEVDNQSFLDFGVDNVQLTARVTAGAVPEPSTYGLFGAAALAALVAWKRSRRAALTL